MPADGEPMEGSCHSLNWVMAGKANKDGGVKQVISPVLKWRTEGLLLQRETLPPTKRNLHQTKGDDCKPSKTAKQTISNMEPR